MSNFFEIGSSHIQPAWESNIHNNKVGGHGCSRFSSPGPTARAAGGAGAGAAGAVPCGGGTSATLSSLQSLRLDSGGEGRAVQPAAAPRLPVWPSACIRPQCRLRGLVPPLLKESS